MVLLAVAFVACEASQPGAAAAAKVSGKCCEFACISRSPMLRSTRIDKLSRAVQLVYVRSYCIAAASLL
jgi:hypothetical protein